MTNYFEIFRVVGYFMRNYFEIILGGRVPYDEFL